VNRSEQAAAYALGELGGVERAAFEERLAEDAELRREVEALRTTMASLEELPGEAWPGGIGEPQEVAAIDGAAATRPIAHEPAPDDAIGTGPTPSREPVGPRPRRRVWSLRPAFAIGAVALALVIGGAAGALINSGGSGSSEPTILQLHSLDAPAKAAADISMPAAETMVLNVHGLPPSESGNYYEVWLMNDPESLVPVASFRVGPSGQARVEVPLPADPTSFRYFDVSRQSLTGGTGHSADSVLRGPT
jgi:anti-sigma-K factor RskA